MVIAVVLIAIVVGSVLFHVASPWWTTPLASNWEDMDDTLTITLVITGVFFVVINLLLAYTVLRYRHRPGRRADYAPENRRLERWLIGVTTVGIVGLLAPGLVVYASYVKPPQDALVVEVLGRQWQWFFRIPDAEGKLGPTDARFVDASNPFGLDPKHPASQDDLLVSGGTVKLPVGRPVKMLLRSHDVLHDFYVPQFRARMNMVPGMVTTFWFTPTETGRFEILCAQLCGVGHSNMRGVVEVVDEGEFQAWLQTLPTFAKLREPAPAVAAADAGAAAPGDDLVARGQALAQAKGCTACHTVDGSAGVGPTWKGLFGKTETFTDGSTALVDEEFLRGFILDPQARNVKGFPPVMPKIELTDAELSALVAYIKSLGGDAAPTAQR
ncbi:cytochrome c oxidase subunit II [Caldimonas thermodepolymerans]|jgi:Heme/copper-type cytochrome/quinol oxidases, subunit 2|uniref:cytochrome-c oxidase n=1 Tax=Caldimonas thermodepolymerans TaxID=215580 RepID=A0AA46HWN7_9BURK|nr:cytochrome c oxidase subunit II [Caldimonas thermodepolymerans]TCP08649.1 cytochrome c oxidase subunit 2 [Caldimonas thermodepolymerans]UZG46975.1 cytochrome c oxidase subunit II [Caldimonas thermodepolymerans]